MVQLHFVQKTLAVVSPVLSNPNQHFLTPSWSLSSDCLDFTAGFSAAETKYVSFDFVNEIQNVAMFWVIFRWGVDEYILYVHVQYIRVCWEWVSLQHGFCDLTLISSAFSRYLRAQRSLFSLETSPSPARSKMRTFPMATSTFSTGLRRSTVQSPPSLSSKLLETSTSKLEKVCTRFSKFPTKPWSRLQGMPPCSL